MKARYEIYKVVVCGSDKKKIYIKNGIGSEEIFLYYGGVWHWDTGHIVEPELSGKLGKAYKKYLKKENKK